MMAADRATLGSGLLLAGGVVAAVAIAVGGALAVSALTPIPRLQHSGSHVSFTAGLAVLVIAVWRFGSARAPRGTGSVTKLLTAGLAIILAGQLLEGIGAFGWAEYDGYLVVNPGLALVHKVGMALFVPGFVTLIAGGVLTLVKLIRR